MSNSEILYEACPDCLEREEEGYSGKPKECPECGGVMIMPSDDGEYCEDCGLELLSFEQPCERCGGKHYVPVKE